MFEQICTLQALAALYGCYLGKLLRQRARGIRTDQLGRGKVGFVRFVELGTKLAAILAPLAELASVLLNTATPWPALRAAGLALCWAGVAVFAASALKLRDNWRAGVDEGARTELVTTGIYRYSRNPAFLGFDLSYLGVLLAYFNWPLCALSIFAALMLHLQIVNVEEDFLIERFGGEYLTYRRQVRRYLGRRRG